MGWHSDNEKSLGIEPIIASLSIGSDREMLFKHKKTHRQKEGTVQESHTIYFSFC